MLVGFLGPLLKFYRYRTSYPNFQLFWVHIHNVENKTSIYETLARQNVDMTERRL
jgi:acid phosphatase class B